MTTRRNERGIALGVAIFALVMIGALVSGALFVGVQEQQVGRNTLKLQQAFSAAEEGAHRILVNWNTDTYNSLTTGASINFVDTLADKTGWYRGTLRKLNDMMYLVDAEGFSADNRTRQRVGLFVELAPLEVLINAALKTQGATKIGGSSLINGYDTPPTGWSCPATKPALPGIRIPDPSQITTSGCSDLSCVQGDPKVQPDPTINDSSLTTFGDLQFEDLAQMANVTVPGGNMKIQPVVSAGQCDRSLNTNWGDPLDQTSPCAKYFPFVYSSGSLSINGVTGQGVLVVNGNLSVQGNFQFYGPVIIKGTLKTTGTGGHFNGGVIAANIELEQNTVLGNAVINYSSCALLKTLSATAKADFTAERSWVSLY